MIFECRVGFKTYSRCPLLPFTFLESALRTSLKKLFIGLILLLMKIPCYYQVRGICHVKVVSAARLTRHCLYNQDRELQTLRTERKWKSQSRCLMARQ